MWLQYAFCKLVIGDYPEDYLHPQYLDLRYKVSDSPEVWESFLQSPIVLSGKNIIETPLDNGLWDYSAVLTAVLAATSFSGTILPQDTRSFRLYLYSGSVSQSHDFAYIDISPQVLSRVTPGVQALVEWTMKLLLTSESTNVPTNEGGN